MLNEFIQYLPVPALIAKYCPDDSINHPILFVNRRFQQEIGYEQTEIPDKETWWQLAYPDIAYRKVVKNQWELEEELAGRERRNFTKLDVLITNKMGEEKRYRVLCSPCPGLPEYIQVLFINIEQTV